MAVLPTTKLEIFNGALRHLGSRKLTSLTENRHPRRVLDDIWGASDNVVKTALERGDWNFAIKSVEATASPAVSPVFGFQYAFTKPDDFRRLSALCSDPYFQVPLIDDEYADENGKWLSDYETIYVRYVSDDGDFGLNSSLWTEAFKDYLQAFMAWEACETLTNSTTKQDRMVRLMQDSLAGAKSVDAMQEGVKFPPTGSWVRSRNGGYGRRRER